MSDPQFREILERALRGSALCGDGGWLPHADLYEMDDAAVIVLELAGVAREDLDISVEGGVLSVSGVRREFVPDNAGRLHNMEIERGKFERRIVVPAGFDLSRAEARLENGFLHLRVPRTGPGRHRVEIAG